MTYLIFQPKEMSSFIWMGKDIRWCSVRSWWGICRLPRSSSRSFTSLIKYKQTLFKDRRRTSEEREEGRQYKIWKNERVTGCAGWPRMLSSTASECSWPHQNGTKSLPLHTAPRAILAAKWSLPRRSAVSPKQTWGFPTVSHCWPPLRHFSHHFCSTNRYPCRWPLLWQPTWKD